MRRVRKLTSETLARWRGINPWERQNPITHSCTEAYKWG